LREVVPGLSDCQPADTIFHRAVNGAFDVVVALYHDQGLAPLKTIEFDTAVNVTLGLPFARTSPDHGTGYDIAGSDVASHRSFSRAIDLAGKLAKRQVMV
jgi:4-hydroxythreonine-4-phosphate dehydrogenase